MCCTVLRQKFMKFFSTFQIIKTNILDWDALAKNIMMKKMTTKASPHGGWKVMSIMVYVIMSPAHGFIRYDIDKSIE
jgi:hypothetical protein